MSASARAWCLAGAVCVLVATADQAAKAAVEANLVLGQQVAVLGPLELTLSHNRGVAFGLAGGGGVVLIVAGLAALAVVGYLFAREPARPWMWLAAGLVGGGAIGNLADRVRADAVTDFVDLAPWPPFNLADVAITAGVLVLVLLYLRDASRAEARGG